jgi:oligopeptide/dipeptide ABC transporter ATP-binding protein
MSANEGAPVLRVEDLEVALGAAASAPRAVAGISFTVESAESVALVGESGSGKTLAALALLRLLPDPPARIAAGRIVLDDRGTEVDVRGAAARDLQRVRGRLVGMVFQEPGPALNPVMTIGAQLGEVLRLHRGAGREEIRREAAALLSRVGIAEPMKRLGCHPYQLSGGMQQRVMIAMAIAAGPRLLIADEPTSALDVTVQAQVLALLRGLREEMGLALLLISHDLGIVAGIADRVLVMYAGRIVESAPVRALYREPRHPYTRALLAAVPRIGERRSRLPAIAGRVPDPGRAPSGCAFRDRCPEARGACAAEVPGLESVAPGHQVACPPAVARPRDRSGGAP